jgi:hypothetical protein
MTTDGTAMPSRWQIDVIVYEENHLYPVLLLEPGHHDDHHALVRLLTQAGFAAPTSWEWQRGLWPWAAGCSVEVTGGPVIVHAGGRRLTVGFEATNPPSAWTCAACRQRQVLFVLVPPRPHAGDEDGLIVDDVGELNRTAVRRGCVAASIPVA